MLAFGRGGTRAGAPGHADSIGVFTTLAGCGRPNLSGVCERTGVFNVFGVVLDFVGHVIEIGVPTVVLSWVVVSWGPASTALPDWPFTVNRLRSCHSSRAWLTLAPLGNVVQVTVYVAIQIRVCCVVFGPGAASLSSAEQPRHTQFEVVVSLPDGNTCGLERTVDNDQAKQRHRDVCAERRVERTTEYCSNGAPSNAAGLPVSRVASENVHHSHHRNRDDRKAQRHPAAHRGRSLHVEHERYSQTHQHHRQNQRTCPNNPVARLCNCVAHRACDVHPHRSANDSGEPDQHKPPCVCMPGEHRRCVPRPSLAVVVHSSTAFLHIVVVYLSPVRGILCPLRLLRLLWRLRLTAPGVLVGSVR